MLPLCSKLAKIKYLLVVVLLLLLPMPAYLYAENVNQSYNCNCVGSLSSPLYIKYILKKALPYAGRPIRLNIDGLEFYALALDNKLNYIAQIYQEPDGYIVACWEPDGTFWKAIFVTKKYTVEKTKAFSFANLSPEFMKKIQLSVFNIFANYDVLTGATY